MAIGLELVGAVARRRRPTAASCERRNPPGDLFEPLHRCIPIIVREEYGAPPPPLPMIVWLIADTVEKHPSERLEGTTKTT